MWFCRIYFPAFLVFPGGMYRNSVHSSRANIFFLRDRNTLLHIQNYTPMWQSNASKLCVLFSATMGVAYLCTKLFFGASVTATTF